MSKGLEALENIRHYDSRVGLHEDDYEIIEKELKEGEKSKCALEIIKRITFYDIRFLDYLLRENIITQEEYNLLKEVL